jgi:hypothetical protein
MRQNRFLFRRSPHHLDSSVNSIEWSAIINYKLDGIKWYLVWWTELVTKNWVYAMGLLGGLRLRYIVSVGRTPGEHEPAFARRPPPECLWKQASSTVLWIVASWLLTYFRREIRGKRPTYVSRASGKWRGHVHSVRPPIEDLNISRPSQPSHLSVGLDSKLTVAKHALQRIDEILNNGVTWWGLDQRWRRERSHGSWRLEDESITYTPCLFWATRVPINK